VVGWLVGRFPSPNCDDRAINRSLRDRGSRRRMDGGLAEFVNMVSGNMESLCLVVAFDFCLCRDSGVDGMGLWSPSFVVGGKFTE
jgi:hypothetical protein